VLRIDASGQTRRAYNLGMQLTWVMMTDLDNDQRSEIFVADRTGWLHELDESLALVRRVQIVTNVLTWADLRPVATLSTGWDTPRQLVLSSSTLEKRTPARSGESALDVPVIVYHDNELILTSKGLRTMTRYSVAKRWSQHPGFTVIAEDLPEAHLSRLHVFTSKADLYEFQHR
jgi:hypothetical protein